MCGDECTGDGQPDPGASSCTITGGVGAIEPLEDVGQVPPSRLKALCRSAGFSRFRLHDAGDPANLYYEVRP